jgi:hypothetical protein
MAHAVIGLSSITLADPARDERFIATVKGEFPNVVNRQSLPPEMPSVAPRLLLASTSSQLAVAAAQVEFVVRFYGEYVRDVGRGLDYVERKLSTVLEGLAAADLPPSTLGIIGTFRYQGTGDEEANATSHILEAFTRSPVESADVQDAMVKVALRIRDTYFVNITVSNYEARMIERPIVPGMPIAVKPWEGEVQERGIELTVDINNLLEARNAAGDTSVTAAGLTATTRLLREVATRTGPEYVASGSLSVEQITETSLV